MHKTHCTKKTKAHNTLLVIPSAPSVFLGLTQYHNLPMKRFKFGFQQGESMYKVLCNVYLYCKVLQGWPCV